MSSNTATTAPVTSWRQIMAIIGAGVLFALALAPVVLGFCAGVAFWALRWLAAAFLEGFHAGNHLGTDT